MATSSLTCSSNSLVLANNVKGYSFHSKAAVVSCLRIGKECSSSVLGRSTRSASTRSRRTKKDLIVRNATPEVADAVSSISIPGFPGLSIPGDNPWLTAAAGIFVVVPFVIQRLTGLAKQVDNAAEKLEELADTVGKVAEEVDKAADEMLEKLPEGGLKKFVGAIEDLAEGTVREAQKVEDLMDVIGDLDDKVEAALAKAKQSKDAEKA